MTRPPCMSPAGLVAQSLWLAIVVSLIAILSRYA